MILNILTIIVCSFLLTFATELILDAIRNISHSTGFSKFAIASLLLAFGTSLPELFIGIQAAINNQSSLSLGNILGSNLANLSIIIGIATLIGGNLAINKNIVNRDIYYTFLISSVPLFLSLGGGIDRLDGILLIILFALWHVLSLGKDHQEPRQKRFLLRTPVFPKKLEEGFFRSGRKLVIGLITLLFSTEMLIKSSISLANYFKIPSLLIGIFLIGPGSSLPELAAEARAIKKRETALAMGDLLGSLVVNSSLVIGLTALINPIEVVQPQIYLTTTLFFLIIFSIFYIFIRTKAKLERWEGAILLMLYFVLVAIELF